MAGWAWRCTPVHDSRRARSHGRYPRDADICPSAWWLNQAGSADERFLRAEAHAAFWAAAALSPAPVINRPARNGVAPRMTAGTIAHAIGQVPANGAGEIHASGPEMFDGACEALWGEDIRYLTSPLSQLEKGVPLRARKLNPEAQYEIVTVVGDRAFPATTDPRTVELDLAARSIAVAQRLGFYFAAVTWSISDAESLPIRVNPAPEEYEVRYAWREVSDALCEALLQ